jgi:hypothetical protein
MALGQLVVWMALTSWIMALADDWLSLMLV